MPDATRETAVAEPPVAAAANRRVEPRIAWGLARAVVSVMLCGYGILSLLQVWLAKPEVERPLIAAVLLAGVLSIQLLHFSRPGSDLRSPISYVLLAAQAVLAYLPLLLLGQAWVGVPSFLAGAVLLALPAIPAMAGYALVVASTAVIQAALSSSTLDVLYTTVADASFGLEVYLLTRLASMVAELFSARDELAEMAVAEERLRFARDLHDLLGLSLSAITLKGELAHRLVHKFSAQARQELSEIMEIARRTLADVRSVASGYQELSLDQEAHSAQSVLKASSVDVRLELDYDDLPAPVRTLLGTVLREGATNVLRHSAAEHCEIVIRQADGRVRLDIVNDGVVTEPAEHRTSDGNGIRNLSERVVAQGGKIRAAPDPDGRFRLHVCVPLHPEPASRPAPAQVVTVPRSAPVSGPAPPSVSSGPSGASGASGPLSAPGRQLADTGSTVDAVRDRSPLADGRSIKVLVGIAFLGMCVSAVIHLRYETTDFWKTAFTVGYLAALLVLQLAYFSRSNTRLGSAQGYALLFVQACLIYLPLLALGATWVSLPGFLGGCALLLLRPVAGWSVFAGTVGTVVWFHAVTTGSVQDIVFNGAATTITGLAVFGLTSLCKLVAALTATRIDLASMAIANERLRFARDLHDLLGLSLSAITLKCDLTLRLLDVDTDRAGDEVMEILGLARQALADVRSVASGYRELSLDDESRSARSVLTAADVNVRMDLCYEELPVLVRTVLAVVLREGVTNILRHSTATSCEIGIRQDDDRVTLEIVNDGVTEELSGDGRGRGISNLSERVAGLGGELVSGRCADGVFRLHASVPV